MLHDRYLLEQEQEQICELDVLDSCKLTVTDVAVQPVNIYIMHDQTVLSLVNVGPVRGVKMRWGSQFVTA